MSSMNIRSWANIQPLMRHPATAWVVLLLLLLLTAAAWFFLDRAVTERAHDRFVYETIGIHRAITDRLGKQARILAGGAGLFAASKSVERNEWRAYVQSLHLEQQYPGLLGLGFSKVIQPRDLAAHEKAVRKEGFPDYSVYPRDKRDQYTSIVYLEPFAGRNLRAFGYDMFSEPVRHAAMATARDSGDVTMSGKVTLVQETDSDVQAGFLMYRPVYRNGASVATLDQRRAALIGYVYSPFRMNDLMLGVFPTENVRIHFRIYDAQHEDDAQLMYSTHSSDIEAALSMDAEFERRTGLTFGGRTWLIRFQAMPGYISTSDRVFPYLVAFCGLLIDFLVFAVLTGIARQRRRAEALAARMTEAVRSSAAREHAIVTQVADGILTMNDSGVIESCNAAAARIFGSSEAVLLGKHVEWLLPESQQTQFRALITAARPAGSSVTVVTEGIRHDGSSFPMEASVTQTELDQHRLIVMVVRDITERQRVERMKGEFVSTVSHELRTPLTSIRGALAIIGSGKLDVLAPQVKELVTIATRNSDRLLNLINDILDIEKLTSGKMPFNLSLRELQPLLENALVVNQSYAEEYQVRYRLGEVATNAVVLVDDNRFQQVMANLLSNAAKFSPVGAEVHITLKEVSNGWRIAVQDSGCGIPETFRNRVFSQFSQADASDTRKRGGTGLGLYISRNIVECMGGRMGFDTKTGGGSTFWFELPAVHDTQLPVHAVS